MTIIYFFEVIEGHAFLKYNITLQQGTHKIGFESYSYVIMHNNIKKKYIIITNNNPSIFTFYIFGL